MKVNKDGFVWMTITKEEAIKCFESGLFTVYILYDDDTESMVQCIQDIEDNDLFGLEMGFMPERV